MNFMSALLKKLNFKDQQNILVLNTPIELEAEITDFGNYLEVIREIPTDKLEFCLIFVKERLQIDTLSPTIDALMSEDALFWWAYPKTSSKKYQCDFNRDSGWEMMGNLGYEPVRMVALDTDWSALRFRKTKFIKTIIRNQGFRISEEGKKR